VKSNTSHGRPTRLELLLHEATESIALPPDGMLVHRKVTSSNMSPVPIYTPGWREKILCGIKFLSEDSNTMAGTRPRLLTFGSEVQRAIH